MTIAAGTVEIANASALGTGTVTMTGGKLSGSAPGVGYGLANALTLNGTMTLGDATNNGVNTFSGTLTVSGASTLTAATAIGFYGSFQGSGNLSLGGNNFFFTGAGSNTYSGALTLTSGGILLANFNSGTPNQLGTTSSLTFNSDLQVLGNTAYTFANVVGGTGTVYVRNTSAAGITFNGSMASYTGSLRAYADSVEGANPVQKITLTRADQFGFDSFWFQSGGGVTSLSQTLSYTGSSSVDMGAPFFIFVGAGPATNTKLSNNSSNGSTFTQSNVLQLATAIGSTFTIDAATGPVVLRALQETSTGVLAVSKTGSSAATIAGPDASSYRGTVQITTGTLNANSATALGLATSTAGISVTSGATLSLGAAATYASRTLAIGGTGVSSTVGALVVNHTGVSTFGGIQLGSPTNYIRATAASIGGSGLDATFTPNNNSVIFGAAAGVDFGPFTDIAGAKFFSGSGSVTYGSHSGDTGEVNANRTHTYTGNTTLAYGTTYVVSSFESPGVGGPLGNKSLTAAGTLLMTGGTLVYANQMSIVDYSGRFATTGGQQWKIFASESSGSSTYTTFSSSLQGNSSLSLMGGELYLSGNSQFSSFTGGVNLVGGVLTLDSQVVFVGPLPFSSPIGLSGTITFTGGTLQYTGSNSYDYSPRFSTNAGQQWKIDTNGQSVTFGTALSSTGGSLAVSGSGTLTLNEANSYSNGTTIAGVTTLKCKNATALGSGGLSQAPYTVLHVATSDGKMTISGAHTNTGPGPRTIRIGA